MICASSAEPGSREAASTVPTAASPHQCATPPAAAHPPEVMRTATTCPAGATRPSAASKSMGPCPSGSWPCMRRRSGMWCSGMPMPIMSWQAGMLTLLIHSVTGCSTCGGCGGGGGGEGGGREAHQSCYSSMLCTQAQLPTQDIRPAAARFPSPPPYPIPPCTCRRGLSSRKQYCCVSTRYRNSTVAAPS